jgi:hypothetical protein
VDGSSEPVGFDHPAFHHVQDLPAGETEVIGCLYQGDLLSVLVFHAINLLARQGRNRTTR